MTVNKISQYNSNLHISEIMELQMLGNSKYIIVKLENLMFNNK